MRKLVTQDVYNNQILLSFIQGLQATMTANMLTSALRAMLSEWHSGLSALRNGRLSEHIVTKRKLREILSFIENQIPSTYKLAFNAREEHLYFDLPLAVHQFAENKLIVRLIVPLVRNEQFTAKRLLMPTYSAFAMPPNWNNQTKGTLAKLTASTDIVVVGEALEAFQLI